MSNQAIADHPGGQSVLEYFGLLMKPKIFILALSNWFIVGLVGMFLVAAAFAYQAVDGLTLPRVNDHLNVVDQRDVQAIKEIKDGEKEQEISRQAHFEAISKDLQAIREDQISTRDEMHWILAGGSLAITIAGLLIGAGAWKIKDRKEGSAVSPYPVFLEQPNAEKAKALELHARSLLELADRIRARGEN